MPVTYTYHAGTGNIPTTPTPTRWVFNDPQTLATYTFELNPTDVTLPGRQKNIVYSGPTGTSGRANVVDLGPDQSRQFNWTGVIITQTFYDNLVIWASKQYPIEVTDDLGVTRTIYIMEFTPSRKRFGSLKITYDIKALFIE